MRKGIVLFVSVLFMLTGAGLVYAAEKYQLEEAIGKCLITVSAKPASGGKNLELGIKRVTELPIIVTVTKGKAINFGLGMQAMPNKNLEVDLTKKENGSITVPSSGNVMVSGSMTMSGSCSSK
jgi:hypothetical protein